MASDPNSTGLDPNLTRFVELITTDQDFRNAIGSGDKDKIVGAFRGASGFTLTSQEMEEAAEALVAAGNLGEISTLHQTLARMRYFGN